MIPHAQRLRRAGAPPQVPEQYFVGGEPAEDIGQLFRMIVIEEEPVLTFLDGLGQRAQARHRNRHAARHRFPRHEQENLRPL